MKYYIPVVEHWEDTDLVLMARVKGSDGSVITQSDVAAVVCHVHDRDAGAAVGDPEPLDVSSVVFNAPQLDSRWTEDDVGYNFLHTVSGARFPEGKTYRVEVVATPVSGSSYLMAVFNVKCRERLSG